MVRTNSRPIRNPNKLYRVKKEGSIRLTDSLNTGRSFPERRRIHPSKGPALAKGQTIQGTASELFIGTVHDRGRTIRRKRRKDWLRNARRSNKM